VVKALTERSWCVVVPHHAGGARVARHRLTAELRDSVDPALLADLTAILAELVGNAIRHAEPLPGGVIRVAWRRRPEPRAGVVELRVTDGGGTTTPQLRVVGPAATDGRGLYIVARLADRWGVVRDGLGQSVWAELGAVARPGPGTGPGVADGTGADHDVGMATPGAGRAGPPAAAHGA
jgi:anti-sigma regulatory factor (Ser/Thr protein kinase)